MEEAFGLSRYLTSSFRNIRHNEYVEFLWSSFRKNYETDVGTFAVLAYHMLFMVFIYCTVWRIRSHREAAMIDWFNTLRSDVRREVKKTTTPFGFSAIREKEIFGSLSLIECDGDSIDTFKELVNARNAVSHANGSIYFESREAVDDHIEAVLHAAEIVQVCADPIIEEIYVGFLRDSVGENEPEYLDPMDQLVEVLIKDNHLSPRDLDVCLGTDLTALHREGNYDEILELHEALRELHSEHVLGSD